MAGSGKVEHEDEEAGGGRLKREDLGNPGTRVDVTQLQRLVEVAPTTHVDGEVK